MFSKGRTAITRELTSSSAASCGAADSVGSCPRCSPHHAAAIMMTSSGAPSQAQRTDRLEGDGCRLPEVTLAPMSPSRSLLKSLAKSLVES